MADSIVYGARSDGAVGQCREDVDTEEDASPMLHGAGDSTAAQAKVAEYEEPRRLSRILRLFLCFLAAGGLLMAADMSTGHRIAGKVSALRGKAEEPAHPVPMPPPEDEKEDCPTGTAPIVDRLNNTVGCQPHVLRTNEEHAEKAKQPEAIPGPVLDLDATLVMSEAGSDDCPEGSVGIPNIATCIAAAQQLGKPMVHADTQFVDGEPAGCVLREQQGDVYFNSPATGQAQAGMKVICSSPFFALGKPETGECPEHMHHIHDEELCEVASELELAKEKKYVGPLQVKGEVRGCIFRVSDGDIYFNEADGEGPVKFDLKYRRPVCTRQKTLNKKPKLSLEMNADAVVSIRVFCFTWSPLKEVDARLLDEVRLQFKKCNGHIFFTDMGAKVEAADDLVKVRVPKQYARRRDENWLHRRDMVALLPCWSYLLKSLDLTQYDWVIHTELVHFLSPPRLRWTIAEFLRVMKDGSTAEKRGLRGALMLKFGNAFLFNQKMIVEMQRQWPVLERAATDAPATGCPEFMRNGYEWPERCSHDVGYPALVELNEPHIPSFGRSGCGQFDLRNGKNESYPPSCWEMMRNPFGESEPALKRAILELAKVQSMNRSQVKAHFAFTEQRKDWELFYNGRTVPIIHSELPQVHKLAREHLWP